MPASSARSRGRWPRSSAGPGWPCSGRTISARARSSSPRSCCRSGCWPSASRGCPSAVERLLGLYAALVATALLYAGVGLYQWATREVFWNPKLRVDNAYAPFFRVNSVFWDPSIYGRYLVVAILATLALVLARLAEQAPRRRDRRDRRDLGRPPVLVLTVELRRADRRHARGRRADLALACRGGARSARRRARLGRLRHAAGAPRAAAGVAAGSQLGHERPGRARRQRAQDRRRPSGPRRRHRQLQARVRREDRAQGGGAEEGRLALDPGDRGRRDGRARGSRCSAGSASSRWRRPFAAAAGRMRDARHSSRRLRLARSPCTASSTTRSSRIRPCGRCSA